MQVFREAIEKNGGPLPLAYYLQPDAGAVPDPGPLPANKTIDLLHTRVDRRTFFECLLHDKNFAILSTFLVSGVPVNAVREEDGATALHIATAATLDILDDNSFLNVYGDGQSGGGRPRTRAGAAGGDDMNSNSGGNNTVTRAARSLLPSPDAAELEEDDQHRTERVLNPPCPNQLILNFLIDNGADVNAPMRNQLGQTPLMVAAARQNVKVAKLLLAKGADMHAQDSAGRTALTYAARYPLLLEAFRVWMGEEQFVSAAVRERLLHTVCRTVGNHYAALYLIEQVGLDVNARDEPAGASNNNNNNTTSYNFNDGASSRAGGVNDPFASSSSPLRSPTASVQAANGFNTMLRSPRSAMNGGGAAAASSTGHTSPASPFLGSSNINNNNNNNNNGGNGVMVEMTNMVTQSGNTPLHCAVSIADVALVRALLSKGADVHAENRSGISPLRLAQSQSQVGQSMKQYWKEEALLLLRPSSPGAIAARRRRRQLHHECNPSKVRAMLVAFNKASPGAAREKVLREETAQYIWQLCTPMDYAQFLCTVILPHVFYYLCCCVLRNFFLLLCVLPMLYGSYVGMQRRDGNRPRSRPLTGLGWCFGYVVAQGICLPLFTTRYYYQYYSFDLEGHAAISWWLIPSCILTFVLFCYLVLVSSPGVVTTTEGQRKGIYASLRNAKGNYPKELLYGIDLRTMVKKPLRAQYCVQLQRVVLRYDQYCTYFSTVIGGGNQRVFFWLHVSLLALLSCFYHYAREYSRLMGSIAELAQHSAGSAEGNRATLAVYQKLIETPFATAERRFGYMYTQVILPFMILMDVYALYNQLCLIARNLTVFDLEHAEDESSVYCFTLGSTAYTLYDHGMTANVCEFFGWSSFTQLVYRVPQINTYLQKIVEDHQRWQLTGGDGCCDDHHGHSHVAEVSSTPGLQSHSNANAKGSNATHVNVVTDGERIGPAEYGDDESMRHQQMLEARQRQAFAAAQSTTTAAVRPASGAAAATAAAIHVGAPAFSPSLPGSTNNKSTASHTADTSYSQRQTQQDSNNEEWGQEEEEEGEGEEGEYDGAYDDDGEDGAQENSILAMQIFQQMVRTGSTDVGRGGGGGDAPSTNSGNGNGGSPAYGVSESNGADAETQREWDAAVAQARQMFEFYRQSLGVQGD